MIHSLNQTELSLKQLKALKQAIQLLGTTPLNPDKIIFFNMIMERAYKEKSTANANFNAKFK
jgi:hypothetical protein